MDSGIVGLVVGTFVLAVAIYVLASLFRGDEEEKKEEPVAKPKKAPANPAATQSKKKPVASKSKKVVVSDHKCLAAELKGHTAAVLGLDFDPSGDYLTSCSEDRTIRVWYSNDFSQREHKYHRINVELDHAVKVNFSPDSRALVTVLDDAQAVRVFKLNRKKDGTVQGSSVALDMNKTHKVPIVNVAIASTGKFVLTMSSDNHLVVWTPKGDILETLDTRQVTSNWADISPCGRFIACAGFTSDVKLWEVKYTKSGEFVSVNRAMELKGHTSAVYHFSFSADSRRMVTISKDGTWKLWDIDVNFELRQDPVLLTDYNHCQHHPCSTPMLAALSPDATTVAVAAGGELYLYRAQDPTVHALGVVHTGEITSLSWDPSSRYLCSAGVDKHINVWHNVTGLEVNVELVREKIRATKSETVKKRLEEQLSDLRSQLDAVCN